MLAFSQKFALTWLCIIGPIALNLTPIHAEVRDNGDQNGKVLSASTKGGHFYRVETSSRNFTLLCERAKGIHFTFPECRFHGKPLAEGSTLAFRVDQDAVYVSESDQYEDKLRILTVELKTIPNPDVSLTLASHGAEIGIVIGAGTHIGAYKEVGWSMSPMSGSSNMAGATNPVIGNGPVLAMPVTGGPPVLVSPSGPVGAGTVTGMPVTGGPPVIAVPLASSTGKSVGGMNQGGTAMAGRGSHGGPAWTHILRVEVGGRIYELEGGTRPFEFEKKRVELGDSLSIRIEKKWAYISSGRKSDRGKEQKVRVVGEYDAPSATTERSAAPPDA